MRRFHSFIGVLALVTAACSGAAADTTTTTTPVAVSTSSTAPPTTLAIEPPQTTTDLEIWAPAALVGPLGDAAAAFEIETGIAVEVIATDPDTMLETLLGDPGAGPDLFVGPHEWLTDLVTAGIAEPLAQRSDVVGGAAAAVQVRSVSYGAPIALDTIAQFRNPALLATAPSTVESFANGCTVRGATSACLLLPATSVDGHWPFVAGLGGYLFGPDEFAGWNRDDVGLDTPEAIAAGLVLDSILDGSGILGDGDTSARERFIVGDAPLLWGSTTDLSDLRDAGMSFVVDRLPTIGDQPSPAPVRVTALWVNAFSIDKEAATTLVENYLATPENTRTLAIALGQAPVDVDFSADAGLAPFTQGARVGHPVPPIHATEFAWAELATAFESIRNGASAQTALDGAASSIRAED
jgi:maltose-binding protein MalE